MARVDDGAVRPASVHDEKWHVVGHQDDQSEIATGAHQSAAVQGPPRKSLTFMATAPWRCEATTSDEFATPTALDIWWRFSVTAAMSTPT